MAPDGSWCQVTHKPGSHGEHRVAAAGAPLWSAVETADARWEELSRPSWEQLCLTAEPGGRQWVWLNSPDSEHTFVVEPIA